MEYIRGSFVQWNVTYYLVPLLLTDNGKCLTLAVRWLSVSIASGVRS